MSKPGKTGRRRKRFSVVAAVKANARAQLGQPKAVRVLPLRGEKRAESKHKATLARTLALPDAD